MRRYELEKLAALVILFLTVMSRVETSLGAPYSPTTGTRAARRTSSSLIQCSVDSTFSFRSQCRDNGFLTVHRNKVFVQTSGLTRDHEDAEFDVEVCRRGGSRRTRQPPVVRYRHRNTNKYICFSRKGRVRVWSAEQVERRGRQKLCMFRQFPVDQTYHRLQSVQNRRWHLAFNHRNNSLATILGREPHRAALPRNGKYPYRQSKCDFQFHAEEKREIEGEAWLGLIELINHSKNNRNTVSKAAVSDIGISTNEVEADLPELDTVRGSDIKISKAYKEKLLQQQALNKITRYQRKRKIRHFKHKKPRLSRRVKNGLKYGRKQPMSKSKI